VSARLRGFLFAPAIAVLAAYIFSPVARAQAVAAKQTAAGSRPASKKSAPAPRRDLSGIWAPAQAIEGIQPNGANAMPADGKPEHELSYTPLGLEMLKSHKSPNGPNEVAPADENDPAHICDPQGFPREELFELRATQIFQTPLQVIMLYTYNKVWRVIWTDGRELPRDPDPRWFGYSVGKWKDDYTLVVATNGTDERTWVDNAGRPHSEDLRVEEVFRRVDRDTLELTLTIDDPKVYRKPWVALDKLRFRRKPPNFEAAEMMCSPSEIAEYNRRHAARGSTSKK
jgi:hypothetical protein